MEKFQKGLRLRIKIKHEAFQIDYTAKLLRRLFDLFDLRLNPVRCLRIALLPQFFGILLRLFFDSRKAVLPARLRKHQLRCRINRNLIQIFHRTLGQHVKASNRLYAVSPQLDSDRILLRQRKNIKNTAPDRKLSHRLDLILFRHIENINNSAANGKLSRFLYLRALFITHFHQLSGKFPLVYR